jgi:hypothetical protein
MNLAPGVACGSKKPRDLSWFFIMGAPRCGTSALRHYLAAHPNLLMPNTTREPHFFAPDLGRFRYTCTLEEFESLFPPCEPQHRMAGEKSAHYLYSEVAAERILSFDPGARFICMVRDPVEMLHSYFYKLRWTLEEDQPDLEHAWRLQDRRKKGLNIPSTCRNPFKLQYRDIACFGSQVSRLTSLAPSRSVKLVVFDDLVRNPRETLENVLSFLQLPQHERKSFPPINPNVTFRFKWVHWATKARALTLTELRERRLSGRLLDSVQAHLRRHTAWNYRVGKREPLNPEFAKELRSVFADDLTQLADLIRREMVC